MNFSYEKFLKPLTSSDKNVKIYDEFNVVKYIINPNNVRTLNVQNNLVHIGLESNKSITLDFSTVNEANLACKKLQQYVDTLKNTNVPYWVHIAVEQEAINFTKGPTGSTGSVGPVGDQGPQGNQGLSAFEVWAQTNAGSQQDFLNSLIGPIGPTGPTNFGNTGDLEVIGQTINALIEDEDIEIVTKGDGNLLFRIDRDGWVLNYGIEDNDSAEIWSSSVTLDGDGNVYMTGGDFSSNYAYVTKIAPNGNIEWQKQINSYSFGESIVYANGKIYLMMADYSDVNYFGNLIVSRLSGNGFLEKMWVFSADSFDAPFFNTPYGYEIAVDEDENVYYVGNQYNFTQGTDIIFGKLNTSNTSIEWQTYIDGDVSFAVDSGLSIKYRSGHIYVCGVLMNTGNSPDVRGDIFVGKYDKDGQKNWAKVIGNTSTYQRADSLTVDSLGNIYLAGLINFGSSTGPSPQSGPYNNFYMKIDTTGSVLWSKALDSMNRSISCIEEGPDGSIYLISTQAASSTPARQSTDLILIKAQKSNGSIVWQQYIGTTSRDAIWANQPPIYALGHRSLAVDPDGKAVYVAGLTRVPTTLGVPEDSAHNAFLISFDQKSLPPGTYSRWRIEDSAFSTTNISFQYNLNITDVTGISDDAGALMDGVTQSVALVFPGVGLSFSSISKDEYVNLLSPNTELFVKGIINIDDNYTLPRASGKVNQVLTYKEGTDVLEWRDQTIKLTFNDYETIDYSIIGTSSMSIHVDELLGTASGQFDDEVFKVDLPFVVQFMGSTFSTAYVSTNSLVTFGAGFAAFSGYSDKNPPLPGIFVEAGDRSLQKLYTKQTAEQFTIRYQGSLLPSGPSLNSNEIAWELTFNQGSGLMEMHIERNYAYGTGFSCLKNSGEITRSIETATASAFRIYKGYGINNTFANRVYYSNIEGLSYSVIPDPAYPGQSLVSLDFANIANANSSFTTLGTTGSLVTVNNQSSFTFHTGIERLKDQFIATKQYFSSLQGLYMQARVPVVVSIDDRIKIGFQTNSGAWSVHVELTKDTPPSGNMVLYNDSGTAFNFIQLYNEGDTLSIYTNGSTAFFAINGVVVDTCAFSGSSSKSIRFKSETRIQNNPGGTAFLSQDYVIDEFRNYPTGAGGSSGSSGSSGSAGSSGTSGAVGATGSGLFVLTATSSDISLTANSAIKTSGTSAVYATASNAYPTAFFSGVVNSAANGNQANFFLTNGIKDFGFYFSNTNLYYKFDSTTGYVGGYSQNDRLTISVATNGIQLIQNGTVVQSSTYVSGQYYPKMMLYAANEGFREIAFGYLNTGATGPGFTTVSNAGNNYVLTSDGSSNSAVAESNLTFDGATLTITGTSSLVGHTVMQQTSEVVTTSFGATAATVHYDFNSGSVWYHDTANTNFTANFTNLPTTNNRVITATIIIAQGATPYAPTALQIAGASQTIKWANGTYSVTADQVDVIGLTFLRSPSAPGGPSAWTQVLGQISTFG